MKFCFDAALSNQAYDSDVLLPNQVTTRAHDYLTVLALTDPRITVKEYGGRVIVEAWGSEKCAGASDLIG